MIRTILLYSVILIILNSCHTDFNNPISVMRKIRKEFSHQTNKEQYYKRASYTEMAKVNNHFVAFSEGYGNLISLGNSFMIPVDNYCLLLNNIRKADSKTQWKNFLTNIYSQTDISNQSDICPSFNALLSSYRWFEINGPLSDENKDRYLYKLIDSGEASTRKIINFSPCDSLHKYLYYGTIIFETKTNHLKSIQLDSCCFYSEPFQRWTTASMNIDYSYNKEKIYLSNLDAFYKIEKLQHWISVNAPDSIAYKISLKKNECTQLNMNDNNPLIHYNDRDWERDFTNSNKCFSDIKKDLELDNLPIDEQFKRNAGKNFYTRYTSKKINNVDYNMLQKIKLKLK